MKKFLEILTQIWAEITQTERYRPEKLKWTTQAYVSNIFRFGELLVGREYGVRPESVTAVIKRKDRIYITRNFFTTEAFLVFIECSIRNMCYDFYKSLFRKNTYNVAFKRVPAFVALSVVVLGVAFTIPRDSSFAPVIFGAVAISGSAVTGHNGSGGGANVTISIATSGTDILVVGGGERTGLTSATNSGNAITLLTGTSTAASFARLGSFANPTGSSNNVVGVPTSTSTYFTFFGATFSGSDGTTSVASNTTNAGSANITGANVTSTSGGLVVDYACHGVGTTTFTKGASQTSMFQVAGGTYANTQMASYQAGTGGTLHNDWTNSGGSSEWSSSSLNINAAGAAVFKSKILGGA